MCGISLDIKAAFDSAWWTLILAQLQYWRCPLNIYQLVRDYLSNRKVVLSFGTEVFEDSVNRGCPQGSCSGPLFWSIVLDDLLRRDFLKDTKVIAYADDIFLIFAADSQRQLETSCNQILDLVAIWGKSRKLHFNPDKTVGILFTHNHSALRPPSLKLGSANVRLASEVKYLGIVIDDRLTWIKHLSIFVERL